MIVTIWRHGEAGSAASDRQRELTDGGRDDVGYGCHQFHETCGTMSILHPDLVLFSAWARTAQTAEIVGSAFTHASLREQTQLQPGNDVQSAHRVLAELANSAHPPAHVVLVSHQPLVSRLVNYYLGDSGQVPTLSPGGLATLALSVPARGCGQLLFWAQPPDYEAVR